MTRSEYQELVEFLGPKFDAIDRRFDAVDRRFDAVEERLTRVEVLGERDRDHLRVLAEGITSVDQKLESFRQEVAEEFRAVRSEMAAGFDAVRSEMAAGFDAHGRLIGVLGSRVSRLEA